MATEISVFEESTMDKQLSPHHSSSFNAVDVQQVCKTYGGKKDGYSVLKRLNLTVPCGTIYGLLGPSGCGKTTLLRCIMGKLSIDSGSIRVFGETPGFQVNENSRPKIGFMPQDIALSNMLVVDETIYFYGRIAGMDDLDIQARRQFLMKFLDIGSCSKKLIGNLSGGQKRRVSMAIALLHEPDLLILDEPTVGVDPVLRANIWEYLNLLVNCKEKPVTIIITTHYIEEAASANNVGLMLHGRMLAQSPPDRLMEKYGCTSLEDVFLKLCLDFKNNNPDLEDDGQDLWVEGRQKFVKPYNQIASVDNEIDACKKQQQSNGSRRNFRRPQWHRIMAFFWKDMKFFLRHIGLFILELLLPPAIIIVFSISVGKALYGLPVGIVNEDGQHLAQKFIDSINKNTIIPVFYNNYSESIEDAKDGKIMGVIQLNSNFSNTVLYRFQNGLMAPESALDQSLISTSLDWTSQQSAYTIVAELMIAFTSFAQNVLTNMELNPHLGTIPIKYYDQQVHGSSDGTFDQFLFPGFLSCATFFMAMGLTAVSLNTERLSGNMERALITGAHSIELLLGHVMAHLVLMLAQIALNFFVAFVIYGFTCDGSYLLAACLTVVQGLCGLNLGFLLSMSFATETTMIMVALFSWFIAIASEGFLWPLEGMSYGVRCVSLMLPQTYAIEGMRSVMNRGWGLESSQVLAGFGISVGWIAFFAILGLIIARSKV